MTRAEDRLILTHSERKNKSPWEKLAIAALPEAVTEVPKLSEGDAATSAIEETLLAWPIVEDQYDTAASITSVALFAACPRKYYLSRYLGLDPEPDGPGTGAIEMGTRRACGVAGQPVESEEARELAERFRASEWGQRALRATQIEHEFDFMIDIDDVILRGQIDLWFEEAGEIVIVDYKTDRDESSAASYALQLRLYALALARTLGRGPDRAVLFYVRSGNAIEVNIDVNVANYVHQLRAAQESGEFPLHAGEQCRKCSFWGGLCPEGREEGIRSGLIYGLPSSFLEPASDGLLRR
ncbi:MAG: PD-(D/E)XK nuclease family protein [Acidobacteriota bacterium]